MSSTMNTTLPRCFFCLSILSYFFTILSSKCDIIIIKPNDKNININITE